MLSSLRNFFVYVGIDCSVDRIAISGGGGEYFIYNHPE